MTSIIFSVASCAVHLQTVLIITHFYASICLEYTSLRTVPATCVQFVQKVGAVVPTSRAHNISPTVWRPLVNMSYS